MKSYLREYLYPFSIANEEWVLGQLLEASLRPDFVQHETEIDDRRERPRRVERSLYIRSPNWRNHEVLQWIFGNFSGIPPRGRWNRHLVGLVLQTPPSLEVTLCSRRVGLYIFFRSEVLEERSPSTGRFTLALS